LILLGTFLQESASRLNLNNSLSCLKDFLIFLAAMTRHSETGNSSQTFLRIFFFAHNQYFIYSNPLAFLLSLRKARKLKESLEAVAFCNEIKNYACDNRFIS